MDLKTQNHNLFFAPLLLLSSIVSATSNEEIAALEGIPGMQRQLSRVCESSLRAVAQLKSRLQVSGGLLPSDHSMLSTAISTGFEVLGSDKTNRIFLGTYMEESSRAAVASAHWVNPQHREFLANLMNLKPSSYDSNSNDSGFYNTFEYWNSEDGLWVFREKKLLRVGNVKSGKTIEIPIDDSGRQGDLSVIYNPNETCWVIYQKRSEYRPYSTNVEGFYAIVDGESGKLEATHRYRIHHGYNDQIELKTFVLKYYSTEVNGNTEYDLLSALKRLRSAKKP